MDHAGCIKCDTTNLHHLAENIQPTDMLVFYTDRFGARRPTQLQLPCHAKTLFEIISDTNRYGYLAICTDQDTPTKLVAINHSRSQRLVTAEKYKYRYQATNHLIFEELSLVQDNRGSPNLVLGTNSDQYLRVDIRNFFTLNFNSDDIKAIINTEGRGPLTLMGNLSFFLRILFFQIELELEPVVLFFKDSIYMPMVIYIPLNARKYLNPLSGLYYTFTKGSDVILDQNNGLPKFDPGIIKRGYRELAEVGISYCRKTMCHFNVQGKLGKTHFSLSLNIARSLVASGFFPLLITDVHKLKQRLDLDISSSSTQRMGIYFETSGLTPGPKEWDFWLRFSAQKSKLKESCPAKVRLTRAAQL